MHTAGNAHVKSTSTPSEHGTYGPPWATIPPSRAPADRTKFRTDGSNGDEPMKEASKWNRSLRDDVDDLERALAAACDQRARCHLELTDPTGDVRQFQLLDATCLIGSGAEAHVQLHDPRIAPVHVAIVRRHESFWAVDHVIPEAANVSWSRTTLNNRPLPAEGSPLTDGDVLQLGPVRVSFHAEPVARVTQALERVVFSPPARRPRQTPAPLNPATPVLRSGDTQSGYTPGYDIPGSEYYGYGPGGARQVHHVYDDTPPEEPASDPLHDLLSKVHLGLTFLKRYKWTLVLGTLLGIGAGAASVSVKPPSSQAVVAFSLVEEASENPADPRRRQNLEFFAAAQRNFASLDHVRRTLEDLGQDTTEAEAIAQRIKLKPIGPDTYQATYAAVAPPEQVERFLDRHLELYLETEIAKTIKVINQDVEFLREKLAESEAALDASKAAMVAFKEEHLQGLPTQAESHYASLLEVRDRERELRGQLERVRIELGHSRNKLKSDTTLRESRTAAAAQYRTRLSGVEQDLAKARSAGKGEEHPDVVALHAERRQLQAEIDRVMKQGDAVADSTANRSYRAMEETVQGLSTNEKIVRTELGQLASERKRLEGLVVNLPDLEARYRELEREHELAEANYRSLYRNLQSAQLQLDLETGRAAARHEIVAPTAATVDSSKKTYVKRGIVGAVIGFILGLGLGIARAFMGRAREVWQTAISKTTP